MGLDGVGDMGVCISGDVSGGCTSKNKVVFLLFCIGTDCDNNM